MEIRRSNCGHPVDRRSKPDDRGVTANADASRPMVSAPTSTLGPHMDGNLFTRLSPNGRLVEGHVTTFAERLGLPSRRAHIGEAAETFARLIEDFLERPASRLVLSNGPDGGYVQFLAEPDGALYAEAASNSYLGEDTLSLAEELEL